MIVMARQPLDKSKQIRVNRRTWNALKRCVAEMAGRKRLDFEGKGLTQEGFLAASWLWMESLGWEALERELAPHVDRLNAIVQGMDDPAGSRPAGNLAELPPPAIDIQLQGEDFVRIPTETKAPPPPRKAGGKNSRT